MKAVFCVLILLLSTAAQSDPAYKWVDEKGVTHYGDRPPAQQPREVLRFDYVGRAPPSPSPSSAEAPAEPPRLELREIDPSLRLQPSPERCEAARQRLRAFETAKRLEKADEFGRSQPLDAEARAAFIDGARQDVERACRGL